MTKINEEDSTPIRYSSKKPGTQQKKSTPLFSTRSDSAVLNQSAMQQRHHLVNAQSNIDSSRQNLSRCEATMANLEESQDQIFKIFLASICWKIVYLFFRKKVFNTSSRACRAVFKNLGPGPQNRLASHFGAHAKVEKRVKSLPSLQVP